MDVSCKKCGLVNEYEVVMKGPHRTAYCSGCGSYIKHLPKESNEMFIMPFGKYKGEPLQMMVSEDERRYLVWLSEQSFVKSNMRRIINDHLETF